MMTLTHIVHWYGFLRRNTSSSYCDVKTSSQLDMQIAIRFHLHRIEKEKTYM